LLSRTQFCPNKRFFSNTSCYYQILGLDRAATQEQISEAYRNFAKEYNSTGVSNNSSENPQLKANFESVSEAYVVLSDKHLRAEYDTTNIRQTAAFVNRVNYDKQEYARTRTGAKYTESSEPTTYEHQLRKSLKDQRKIFNVDEFGRFKGGLPHPKNILFRGASSGDIGDYLDESQANMIKVNQDGNEGGIEMHITSQEVDQFNNYKNLAKEKTSETIPWTWWKAEVDYDFVTLKFYWPYIRYFRNTMFLLIFAGLFCGSILRAKRREAEAFLESLKTNKEEDYDAKVDRDVAIVTKKLDSGMVAEIDPNGVVKLTGNPRAPIIGGLLAKK